MIMNILLVLIHFATESGSTWNGRLMFDFAKARLTEHV